MTAKKKVLVISYLHLFSNGVGSLRSRKIAKYLWATGKYDVSILTTVNQFDISGKTTRHKVDLSIIDEEDYICEHICVPHTSSIYKYRVLSKPLRNVGRFIRKTLRIKKPQEERNGVYAFNLLDDTSFYRRSKKVIRKKKLWEADIVFSTFGHFASHYIARYIKQKNPAVVWVADFQDPTYLKGSTPWLFRTYSYCYPGKVCRRANAITAVSQGFLDIMCLPENTPAYVLPNGFDPDDIPKTENCKNEKLILSYTGTIRRKKQDITALFGAIRELIDEGVVDEGKILIEYAGSTGGVFVRQAEIAGTERIVCMHGLVEREKALEIQKKSDILLMASWNFEGYTGVITAKVYEYMMMKKPVISIVTGDIPNSEIKELINQCKLGFCYEQACHDGDYVLLKDYIHKQYRHFIEYGTVLYEPNNSEIDKNSYLSITGNLEKLF